MKQWLSRFHFTVFQVTVDLWAPGRLTIVYSLFGLRNSVTACSSLFYYSLYYIIVSFPYVLPIFSRSPLEIQYNRVHSGIAPVSDYRLKKYVARFIGPYIFKREKIACWYRRAIILGIRLIEISGL